MLIKTEQVKLYCSRLPIRKVKITCSMILQHTDVNEIGLYVTGEL